MHWRLANTMPPTPNEDAAAVHLDANAIRNDKTVGAALDNLVFFDPEYYSKKTQLRPFRPLVTV